MARGRKTGGRQVGTPNKSTLDVRGLALQHGPQVILELVRLATCAVSEPARVSACREILDRAYGQTPQSIAHSGAIEFILPPDWNALSHLCVRDQERLPSPAASDAALGDAVGNGASGAS